MSSLSDVEKRYFETLLSMQQGYVLDFSDATFGEFFARHNVDIHGPRYKIYGTSKAKKLRAFWERESDQVVGKVLNELLDSYEATCELGSGELNASALKKARAITSRLVGKTTAVSEPNDEDFLDKEYAIPNLELLPVVSTVVPIISARLDEARAALRVKAYLAVIFMCGSVLEAVLLGVAQSSPQKFNSSPCAPKSDGKVKKLHEWSLAQLIDVATDVHVLKPDVKKFSHGLRDFRNYIHPYQQLSSGFSPDEHTAKLCFQALKAALADVAGKR